MTLPPLRERGDDVLLLADFFLKRFAEEAGRPKLELSPEAKRFIVAYPWPGNVRELRNVIERAIYRHEDPERAIDTIIFNPFQSPWAPTATVTAHMPSMPVTANDAEEIRPSATVSNSTPAIGTSDFRSAVADYERQLLEEALRRNRFNQRATAAALNLSYDQLRHALKRHKLQDSAV
jgi:psp operon transcriptional activator